MSCSRLSGIIVFPIAAPLWLGRRMRLLLTSILLPRLVDEEIVELDGILLGDRIVEARHPTRQERATAHNGIERIERCDPIAESRQVGGHGRHSQAVAACTPLAE